MSSDKDTIETQYTAMDSLMEQVREKTVFAIRDLNKWVQLGKRFTCESPEELEAYVLGLRETAKLLKALNHFNKVRGPASGPGPISLPTAPLTATTPGGEATDTEPVGLVEGSRELPWLGKVFFATESAQVMAHLRAGGYVHDLAGCLWRCCLNGRLEKRFSDGVWYLQSDLISGPWLCAANPFDQVGLQWTSETPTQSGWYWVRNDDEFGEGRDAIVEVSGAGGVPWVQTGRAFLDLRTALTGPTLWAGPIEKPH